VSLCSKCSAQVKPIVAIDLDGTLSEYHGAISKFACDYWDVRQPMVAWNGRGNMEDHLGLTQAQYREAKLAYRQGGYKRTANWQPGAHEFMSMLAFVEDIEIWITTTRPWNRLDSVDPDTRFWLDRHHVRYDHLLYDDHKYHKLAELVDPSRVILVVEDLPEMIREALEVFKPEAVVRMHRLYNWQVGNECGLQLFSSLSRVLLDNLRLWKEGKWTA